MNKILRALKEATAHQHQLTEKYAYANEMKSGDFDINMYKNLLFKNFYIHKSIEICLFQQECFQTSPLKEFYISKIPLLEKDLQNFDDCTDTAFTTNFKIDMKSVAHVVGIFYVVEGSTLGGQLISKILSKNPTFNNYKPFHFFSNSGISTSARWKTFASMAEDIVTDHHAYLGAEQAAVTTFQFFSQVYQENN